MHLKELLKKFIKAINEKASSSSLKDLDRFAIVEHVFEEEISEEELEKIKKLLDELDD